MRDTSHESKTRGSQRLCAGSTLQLRAFCSPPASCSAVSSLWSSGA